MKNVICCFNLKSFVIKYHFLAFENESVKANLVKLGLKKENFCKNQGFLPES